MSCSQKHKVIADKLNSATGVPAELGGAGSRPHCSRCGCWLTAQGSCTHCLTKQVAVAGFEKMAHHDGLIDPTARARAAQAFQYAYECVLAEQDDRADWLKTDRNQRTFQKTYEFLTRNGFDLPLMEDYLNSPKAAYALQAGYWSYMGNGLGIHKGGTIYLQLATPDDRWEDTVRAVIIDSLEVRPGWSTGWEYEATNNNFGPEVAIHLEHNGVASLVLPDLSTPPDGPGGTHHTVTMVARWYPGVQPGLPTLPRPEKPATLKSGEPVELTHLSQGEIYSQPDYVNEDGIHREVFGEDESEENNRPELWAEYKRRLADARTDNAYRYEIEGRDDGIRMRYQAHYTVLHAGERRVGLMSLSEPNREGRSEIRFYVEPDVEDDNLVAQALPHALASYADRFHISRFYITAEGQDMDKDAKRLAPLGFVREGEGREEELRLDLSDRQALTEGFPPESEGLKSPLEIAMSGRERYRIPEGAMDPGEHYDAVETLERAARGFKPGQYEEKDKPPLITAQEYAAEAVRLARLSPANPGGQGVSTEFYDGYYSLANDMVRVAEKNLYYTDAEKEHIIGAALDILTQHKEPQVAAENIMRVFIKGHGFGSGAPQLTPMARQMAITAVLKVVATIKGESQLTNTLNDLVKLPEVTGEQLAPFVPKAGTSLVQAMASQERFWSPGLVDQIIKTEHYEKIAWAFRWATPEQRREALRVMHQNRNWLHHPHTYEFESRVLPYLGGELLAEAGRVISSFPPNYDRDRLLAKIAERSGQVAAV